MFEFTTNQWAILGLVLVLGWLLGLMTLAGGRKWKKGFLAERERRVALENDRARLDARIAELEADRERLATIEAERDAHATRIAAANSRIAELERERAATPVSPATAGSIAMAASGQRDDLSLIFGVGRGGEQRLNDLGIHRYRDITGLTAADEAALEGRLGLTPGEIDKTRWREQADLLARGKYDEHARLFA